MSVLLNNVSLAHKRLPHIDYLLHPVLVFCAVSFTMTLGEWAQKEPLRGYSLLPTTSLFSAPTLNIFGTDILPIPRIYTSAQRGVSRHPCLSVTKNSVDPGLTSYLLDQNLRQ